ncbi:MAG: cysteine desulfurase [Paracoccaceae bacterium]
MFDIISIRKEFPILEKKIRGRALSYLDNGASAQKPKIVIDTIKKGYESEYANVHRGLHFLSNLATDKFESVRDKIKNFLGAENEKEIIFTSGSTEGINLVAYAWAQNNLKRDDEILLSIAEHHSNIVPWHFLREKIGIKLKWIEPREDGSINADDVINLIGSKTKLITITHMSNVLGSIVDVKKICNIAKKKKIITLIDGSQSAVHMPINVVDLNCDFFVFTGHKLYGPSASGAIYINQNRFEEMEPFIGGGSMINFVGRESITYNKAPHKFEAGTPAIIPIIGLGAAIDFILSIGQKNIIEYENKIASYAKDCLYNLDFLNFQGTSQDKGGIFSFTMKENKLHPHDIATIVDQKGVAVRAGHHCAQPLLDHLRLTATCRASLGLYNNEDDIDHLIDALKFANSLI